MSTRLFIGSSCVDARNRRVGIFNGVTKCGKFAVVKYRGARAVIVPLIEVKRVYGREVVKT